MPVPHSLLSADVEHLRQAHYNAEVLQFMRVHEDLSILRVRPDGGVPSFRPGQYCVLGLGNWEPRLPGTQPEPAIPGAAIRLMKRAYSFGSPLVDDEGRLLPPARCPYLEFYIVLIRDGEENPPALTPRLFRLQPGNRLFVGPKVTGHYTLEGVGPDQDCVFIATGTGEAPHNAMLAHLLDDGHCGRLVVVTCVRYQHDLAYLDAYRQLERRFTNLTYRSLTTREPRNVDPDLPDYVGRRYVQDYFQSGDFEREAGIVLDPDRCHVFLCGNPAMIGAPRPQKGKHPRAGAPPAGGMIAVLAQRGFEVDPPGHASNVHFEKYW